MTNLRTIIRLYESGIGLRPISGMARTSRNTVKKYISLYNKLGIDYQTFDNKSDAELHELFCVSEKSAQITARQAQLEDLLPDIVKRLKKEGATSQDEWIEYIKEHPEGYGLTQFRYRACVEEVDYTLERGLDQNQVERLASMEFLKSNRDLFITGPTGTGKSYLATALGYRACQEGFRVLYSSTARLISSLKIAKAKGVILNELKRIERCDLLILDDFAMQGFDAQGRSILMDVIEDRHSRRSTILTS